jgi:hypothetical protein
VGLLVGRQPHLVIQISLFEHKAGAALDAGQHSTGQAEVADKIGFQAHDIFCLLIDPHDAG